MLTIVTPASSINLTTLQRFKDDLGTTLTSDDAYITSLITGYSAAAASFCRRNFGLAAYSETFRPPPASGGYSGWAPRPLSLSAFPVAASPSLVVVANGVTLAAGTDYELDAPSGMLTRLDANGNETGWPRQLITVSYSAGWNLPGDSLPNLPADIERAVLLMVRCAYLSRNRDPLLKTYQLPDVETASFGMIGLGSADLLPEAESLLAPWRLPVL